MKRRRRILGAFAAVVLAAVGVVALVAYVNSAKDKAESKEALTNVYVLNKLVPKGSDAQTIKSAVSEDKVPNRLVQPGAVTSLQQVADDKVAAVDLQPGDQLLEARLIVKEQVDAAVKDKVQVSAQLTPERAVGGVLQKGDTVGVYLSFPPFDNNKAQPDTSAPDKSPNMTHLEFQHVLVTNIQTTNEPVATSDNSKDQKIEQVSGSQYIVTLALSPAQSERFVFAAEFGHVWLSNEAATVSDDGTTLITLGNAYTVVK